jgi:hypothetical protein
MPWSILRDPEFLKLSGATLGLGAAVFTVVDKVFLSRKKQLPPSQPVSQTFNYFVFDGERPALGPVFLKNLVA